MENSNISVKKSKIAAISQNRAHIANLKIAEKRENDRSSLPYRNKSNAKWLGLCEPIHKVFE